MLSARALNRTTLLRQGLIERQPVDAVEGVRRAVALQAQEPPSPYVALWNRIDGFEADDLSRAFSTGAVIKASLMRITLHAVTADDYPAFHRAMRGSLRASRVNDRRFESAGLVPEHADELIPALVEFGSESRTKADIDAFLADLVDGEPEPQLWWALRTYAPLAHAPVDEPWSFGRRPEYRSSPRPWPEADLDAALEHLVLRYLEGFGPAGHDDVAQFTLLRRSVVSETLQRLGDRVVTLEAEGGRTVWDVPDAPVADESVDAPPRLLGMWDSILFAYRDRTRVIPERWRKAIIRSNGDSLPTVLVDGNVAGVWRLLDGQIEVTAFEKLNEPTWTAIEEEAVALLQFLMKRDPTTYTRYHRWWNDLPEGEVRLVG